MISIYQHKFPEFRNPDYLIISANPFGASGAFFLTFYFKSFLVVIVPVD